MNFNFELILFYLMLACGLLVAIDIRFLAKRRLAAGKSPEEMPAIIDYARSFFPVLLAVFLLRSFLYEPFRIPSGSLKPTLLSGDFILVNKFHYGIRLPVIHTKILANKAVKRGDIMVFRFPVNPSIDFIKRVIGLPGDKISYINKTLYVNGEKAPQVFVQRAEDDNDGAGFVTHVNEYKENLLGVSHAIYRNPEVPATDFQDLVVPPGHYFVMGDNRDNSDDGRDWGFVPEENIIGKASWIWMSWNSAGEGIHKIRWARIGEAIH